MIWWKQWKHRIEWKQDTLETLDTIETMKNLGCSGNNENKVLIQWKL
jgi:hypothetical protein